MISLRAGRSSKRKKQKGNQHENHTHHRDYYFADDLFVVGDVLEKIQNTTKVICKWNPKACAAYACARDSRSPRALLMKGTYQTPMPKLPLLVNISLCIIFFSLDVVDVVKDNIRKFRKWNRTI